MWLISHSVHLMLVFLHHSLDRGKAGGSFNTDGRSLRSWAGLRWFVDAGLAGGVRGQLRGAHFHRCPRRRTSHLPTTRLCTSVHTVHPPPLSIKQLLFQPQASKVIWRVAQKVSRNAFSKMSKQNKVGLVHYTKCPSNIFI